MDLDIAVWREQRGPYLARFARTPEDRLQAQRLRFEVFSRELGARLEGAERGLDLDPLDERADHLMVVEQSSGECVGTYRLVTREQLGGGESFYTERIFEMDGLEPAVREQGVELGRACVALPHRTRGVFQMLLRGIGAYLIRRRKQFLFGCGSVPLKDPGQATLALEEIGREGWLDPALGVSPTPAYGPDLAMGESGARPEIPALLHAYCALGARLAPAPAYDPDFRTLDFFVLLDLELVDPRIYARYCEPR